MRPAYLVCHAPRVGLVQIHHALSNATQLFSGVIVKHTVVKHRGLFGLRFADVCGMLRHTGRSRPFYCLCQCNTSFDVLQHFGLFLFRRHVFPMKGFIEKLSPKSTFGCNAFLVLNAVKNISVTAVVYILHSPYGFS